MDYKVSVTTGNKKMGHVLNLSMPTSVCRADAPCRKGCYARSGTFCYKNVQNCYLNNLNAFLESPERFKTEILKQLPIIGVFRWHTSGDIVNMEYLEIMVEIARKATDIRFLCFTKKYELVNKYLETHEIPSNLKMVFSGWKGLVITNPNNLPIAWMYDHKDPDERIPQDALPCNGGCVQCMVCWKLGSGESVVFDKH